MKYLITIIACLLLSFQLFTIQSVIKDIEALQQVKEVPYTPKNKVLGIQIANAIKDHESGGNYKAKGGSGEYGAYQMMPSTYKSLSKNCLGDVLPPTPENQDKIVHCTFEKLIKEGRTKKEIIRWWNSGSFTRCTKGVNRYGVAYDCPSYVQKVLARVK